MVWSSTFSQGFGRGFALVLYPDRLVGTKRSFSATLIVNPRISEGRRVEAEISGPGGSLSGGRVKKLLEDVEGTIADLSAHARFSIPWDEIRAIEVTPPGPRRKGELVIRSVRGAETIEISASATTEEGKAVATLRDLLEKYAPGKTIWLSPPL